MKNYKLDIRKIKKGCIVKMKASSGIKGYGNHQCISEQHGTLNTISLYGHNQHYDVHDILEIIDSPFFTLEQQQAEIEQLKKDSEWISVNDALPNDDGGYLTCVSDDDDFYINYFINYFGDDEVVEWTSDQEITHWKPLPKPPEG